MLDNDNVRELTRMYKQDPNISRYELMKELLEKQKHELLLALQDEQNREY